MAKPVLGKSVSSDWFFLGRDFAVRTFSMETVQAVYFCFGAKPANSNLQPKQRKKMCLLLFFIAKLQEKVKKIAEFLLRFQRWMKKTNILRARSVLSSTSGNFWCRDRHRRKPGGQRRFYQLTEKGKLLNTNKKTATDMTLVSATLKLMVWKRENWKLTCVRAWPLFVEICLNARRKNGEE